MNVTAVESPSAARTKKCHGCNPRSGVTRPVLLFGNRSAEVAAGATREPPLLVEISEFIVQTLVEFRIAGVRHVGGICCGRGFAARESHGDESYTDRTPGADKIREEPRQAVESFVERSAENVLAAVFRD